MRPGWLWRGLLEVPIAASARDRHLLFPVESRRSVSRGGIGVFLVDGRTAYFENYFAPKRVGGEILRAAEAGGFNVSWEWREHPKSSRLSGP
jgi:hypothetical protein